jgi:hypothetical protein
MESMCLSLQTLKTLFEQKNLSFKDVARTISQELSKSVDGARDEEPKFLKLTEIRTKFSTPEKIRAHFYKVFEASLTNNLDIRLIPFIIKALDYEKENQQSFQEDLIADLSNWKKRKRFLGKINRGKIQPHKKEPMLR